MNRNTESHFSTIPSAEIQRSTFDRSCNIKTSFSSGELIPFFLDEVLPGDTFDITTAKVVRSQTMVTPVMDNMYLDTYYFFVPNRLVWKHWNEFCGENTSGAWSPSVEYDMPCLASPTNGFVSGTIADYFGLPLGVEWNGMADLAPSALPFRAYALICNEFFRDENLSDPLLIPTEDAHQMGSNGNNYIVDCANGGKPFKVAKLHDYFTSALPMPQKGNAVGIPIDVPVFSGGNFPVKTMGFNEELMRLWNLDLDSSSFVMPSFYPSIFVQDIPKDFENGNPMEFTPNGSAMGSLYTTNHEMNLVPSSAQSGSIYGSTVAPFNHFVSIDGGTGTASAEFSVNELRLAFAYQRYLESLARSGSRYTEMLLGLFGVKSPDSRLQRPEYLGGNRIPINVHEVTNNAQTDSDWLGDIGAKSQTNDQNHDFVKSFTEHGYIIGLMCVRYDHSYSQGMPRFFTRKKFTDFYNPKFANLGEVPIYKAEIFATEHNLRNKDDVFGYQEIWADYRVKPNIVTGEMRPDVKNSLSHWHLGDFYSEEPYLCDEWIRETSSNVDRVLAVTSDVAHQFWADIFVRNKCTRCMPMYSVPGLIDHF